MSDSRHIHVMDPIYIKHSDLQNLNGDFAAEICAAAEHIDMGCVVGVQRNRGLWLLFIRSDGARLRVLNNDLKIQNKVITTHGCNPYEMNQMKFSDSIRTEKITFKDIPLSDIDGTKMIERYIVDHPQLAVMSDVCYSRIKINNKLTPFRSGDRFVYVKADFSPALPENTQIGCYNVRISHRSQEPHCRRCDGSSHRTDDIQKCPNYQPDDGKIVAFREDWDIFSNFFMCKVKVFGRIFKSAEHAYQWKKAMDCLREDVADSIQAAPSARQAKKVASLIDGNVEREWRDAKGHIIVMSDVLMAKAGSNIDFRSKLLNTGNRQIVEATSSIRWGCGQPPDIAVTSKSFPGKNLCGKLLMELRDDLQNSSPLSGKVNLRPHSSRMPCSVVPVSNTTSKSTCGGSVDPESSQQCDDIIVVDAPPKDSPKSLNNADSSSQSLNQVPPVQAASSEEPHVTTTGTMDVEIIPPTDQKKTPPHDVASSSDRGNDTRASSGDLKEYQLPVIPRTPPPRNKTFPFKTMSKSRPQSPLIGKLVYRKHLKPRRLLKPPDSSESDMDSEASTGEWPNWDKDSIASEISNVEDCNMLL